MTEPKNLKTDPGHECGIGELRERVNRKTGKVTIVRGSTPIKESVTVIKEETTMEQLRRSCEVCKECWGITACNH